MVPKALFTAATRRPGAINVLTKDPDYVLSAGGEIEGGNFSDFRATGDVNLPVNDWISVRGAFQVVSRDGYLDDGTDDDHTQSGRLKVRFDFSQDLRLIVGGDYTHEGGTGVGASLLTGPNQFVGGNAWVGNTSPPARRCLRQHPRFHRGQYALTAADSTVRQPRTASCIRRESRGHRMPAPQQLGIPGQQVQRRLRRSHVDDAGRYADCHSRPTDIPASIT